MLLRLIVSRTARGLAVTLATLVVLELLQWLWPAVPRLTALVILAVVVAAYLGGRRAGLASAGLAFAYLMLRWSQPDALFQYARDDGARLVVLAVALPLAGGLVGWLRELGDRRLAALESELRERRRAQDALQEIAHQRDQILAHSLDVICTADTEGRFTMVSSASERLWGYRPEELVGRPYLELVHPDDRERTQDAAAAIIAGGQVVDFENRYLHLDGHSVDVMWSAQFSPIDQLIYAVAHDITQRKRDEAERIRANRMIAELKGLLSVCAWCNKIRRADGTWERFETYVEGHSAARFSHAMCPDCLAKRYPEED